MNMPAPPDLDSPNTAATPTPMFKWPFLAAMLLVVVVLFSLGMFLPSRNAKSQLIVPPVEKQAATAQLPIKVHVIGEVNAPGLYECRSNERIQDAITRAGGATPNADINAVNLSAFLEDGQQIKVPTFVVATPAPPPIQPGTVANAQTIPGQPLDLNTATSEQLETLPEIGPATAKSILTLRQQRGRFKSVEELDDIPGIGAKKLEALRPFVTVN